jgi:DNA polymerase-3 subunit gamma/tau
MTLKNAIDTGRVAHAFLFTGARGVGKTSSARILAKALNCEQGMSPEPCNACTACQEITAGNSVDVFEIDGASNTSVDDIRELRENVKYLPSRSRYKIFIIDEVHMLSTSAFNALLKTLEEPPAHIKFIFATTEPHKVPITILSRCQRFDFRRIPLSMIVDRLRHIVDQEKVTISDAALSMIARKGDGSMRDSLSTLDQVLAFSGEQVGDGDVVTLLGVVDRRILLETSRAVLDRDSAAALDIARQVDVVGYNVRTFCQELIEHFRNMMLFRAVGENGLTDLASTEIAGIKEQVANVEVAELQRHLAILLRADQELPHSSFPRLVLEMALLKMATLAPVVAVNEILARLKALEGMGYRQGAEPASTGKAERRPTAPSVQRREAQSQARVVANKPTQEPPATGKAAQVVKTEAVSDSWPLFIDFVRQKKPLLASCLDHARPLKIEAERLDIGLASGSFHLGRLQDQESLNELKELAVAFFSTSPVVRLVPLSDTPPDAPMTLMEKKSHDEEERLTKLRRNVEQHPLVSAALDIFGGELSMVSEKEPDKD